MGAEERESNAKLFSYNSRVIKDRVPNFLFRKGNPSSISQTTLGSHHPQQTMASSRSP